jgi:transcriptional regulator with XRE-family HTH domain
MTFGEIIKKRRKKLGLNQTKLAELCGITQTTMSLIECNDNPPSNKTLKALIKHLSIHPILIELEQITEDSISEDRREFYKTFFPTVKHLLYKILDKQSC